MSETENTALAIPGQLTETSLTLPPDLLFDEWERVGETLKRVERSARWWLGDWLAHGERSYGESYSQAVETTGRSYSDLSDMMYVARAIPPSERSENLSWSHHREVAALEPESRQAWIQAAEENDWSTRELKKQLREVKSTVKPEKVPACKKCGTECAVCRATNEAVDAA